MNKEISHEKLQIKATNFINKAIFIHLIKSSHAVINLIFSIFIESFRKIQAPLFFLSFMKEKSYKPTSALCNF